PAHTTFRVPGSPRNVGPRRNPEPESGCSVVRVFLLLGAAWKVRELPLLLRPPLLGRLLDRPDETRRDEGHYRGQRIEQRALRAESERVPTEAERSPGYHQHHRSRDEDPAGEPHARVRDKRREYEGRADDVDRQAPHCSRLASALRRLHGPDRKR